MKDVLAKLTGVLAEADLTALQDGIKKSIDEKASLKIDEAKKEIQTASDKKLNEAIEAKTAELQIESDEKVKALEEHLISEIDRFLETQVIESISDERLEDAGRNAACQPVVEAIMGIFENQFVRLDTEGHGLLKEAASEIESKRTELSEKISENMDLKAKIESFEKKEFISESVKDLSAENKKRVALLFEDKSLEETKEKIGTFIELITEKKEEPVKPAGDNKLMTESIVPEGDAAVTEKKVIPSTEKQIMAQASAFL